MKARTQGVELHLHPHMVAWKSFNAIQQTRNKFQPQTQIQHLNSENVIRSKVKQDLCSASLKKRERERERRYDKNPYPLGSPQSID